MVTFPTTAGQNKTSHPFFCSTATSGTTTERSTCIWAGHFIVHTSSEVFKRAGETCFFVVFLKKTAEKFAASLSPATKAIRFRQHLPLPQNPNTIRNILQSKMFVRPSTKSFQCPPKLEHHHHSLLKDLIHGDTWKSDKVIVFYTYKWYNKTNHLKQHSTLDRGLTHISLQKHLTVHLFHVFKRGNLTVKCNMWEYFFKHIFKTLLISSKFWKTPTENYM